MKVLLTFDDRLRHDSTGVYFYHAFSKVADVVKVYNEELPYINPKHFDLCVKIDDGLSHHKFPKEFHPSVYYVIDTHIDQDWRLELAKEAEFDYIFCAQKPGTKLGWHTDSVFWLPLGCDPNFHYVNARNSSRYDICFVGNVQPFWQKRRVERLDKLFRTIKNYYFGNVFFREVAEKYAESKLVFNSAHSNDINMRVFEALCSGTALLTDKQDWNGLFIDDWDLISYSNDEEMLDKAKYYIEHEDERKKIAARGQQEVLKNHTYLHRVKTIINVAKGIHNGS